MEEEAEGVACLRAEVGAGAEYRGIFLVRRNPFRVSASPLLRGVLQQGVEEENKFDHRLFVVFRGLH